MGTWKLGEILGDEKLTDGANPQKVEGTRRQGRQRLRREDGIKGPGNWERKGEKWERQGSGDWFKRMQ